VRSVMRFPKVVFIATALVVVPALAVALLLTAPSRVVEVRLSRVLLTEGKPPVALGDQRALDFAGKTGLAQLRIQVPAKSGIWITDRQIGVETLGVRGDWTRTASIGDSASAGGRTISRTMWLALPARVKKCRFTIGFRRQTLREEGKRLLDQSGCSRRFPTISDWITKHLPRTERWLDYRCEVPVTASSIQPEAYNPSWQPTPVVRLSAFSRFAARSGCTYCSTFYANAKGILLVR
jgi:hypothetical protein